MGCSWLSSSCSKQYQLYVYGMGALHYVYGMVCDLVIAGAYHTIHTDSNGLVSMRGSDCEIL